MSAYFPDTVFSSLDYGIYWFKDSTTNQKAIKGVVNPYFDKTKPTLIYVHGWQNGSSKAKFRETFKHEVSENPKDVMAAWKAKGFNIGIFYWNQFSDEGNVRDAQCKIWSATGDTAGVIGMRWRNSSEVYSDPKAISKSASELFFDELTQAMSGYTGTDLRIAGHSLGNQMAIAVTEKLSDAALAKKISANLVPKRVALLDPAYLKADAKWLGGQWAGEIARAALIKLKARSIVFETLRSSAASDSWGLIGDSNDAMIKLTAFREMKPWYFNATQIAEKHSAAIWTYLWEMEFQPNTVKSGGLAPTASMPTVDVAAIMNSTKKYVQESSITSSVGGTYSKSPADNVWVLANK